MLTKGGRSRKSRAIVFNLNFEKKVIWSGHSIVVTAGPPEGTWGLVSDSNTMFSRAQV